MFNSTHIGYKVSLMPFQASKAKIKLLFACLIEIHVFPADKILLAKNKELFYICSYVFLKKFPLSRV